MTGQFGFLNIPLPFAKLSWFRIRGARACHGRDTGETARAPIGIIPAKPAIREQRMHAFNIDERAGVGSQEARREDPGRARRRRRPGRRLHRRVLGARPDQPQPLPSRTRPKSISASPAAARCALPQRDHRRGAGLVLRPSAGRGARIHQRAAAHAAVPGAPRHRHAVPPRRMARQSGLQAERRTTPNITGRTRRAEPKRAARKCGGFSSSPNELQRSPRHPIKRSLNSRG